MDWVKDMPPPKMEMKYPSVTIPHYHPPIPPLFSPPIPALPAVPKTFGRVVFLYKPVDSDQLRLIRIRTLQQDPLIPTSGREKPVTSSIPTYTPVLTTKRKITAEEREQWKIPPAISHWKNPKGYILDIEQRIKASQGGGAPLPIQYNQEAFQAFQKELKGVEEAMKEEREKEVLEMDEKIAISKQKLRAFKRPTQERVGGNKRRKRDKDVQQRLGLGYQMKGEDIEEEIDYRLMHNQEE